MGKMEENWEKKDKRWPIDKWIFGLAIFVYYLMTFAFSRERNKLRKREGKFTKEKFPLELQFIIITRFLGSVNQDEEERWWRRIDWSMLTILILIGTSTICWHEMERYFTKKVKVILFC